MSSAGTIRAETAALQTAAGLIAGSATVVRDAIARVESAESAGAGGFGGEPAGAASSPRR